MVSKTIGWEYDPVKDKQVQKYSIIGYAATKTEALQMLAEYNNNPFDISGAKTTFREVYEQWSKEKYPTVSKSSVHAYSAGYSICEALYDKPFKEIKLADLQMVVDTSEKNYPTLKKLKLLFNQLYDYAMKNDICGKDYSEYVDIAKFKDKNPNKHDRQKFSKEEVDKLWLATDQPYYQIVLMLIYTGCRISELLDLKKENVHLDEQYFDIISSKTENGIRKVPIADKVLPFFREWYENSQCEYLLYSPKQQYLNYYTFRDSYWKPLMDNLGFKHDAHETRHTFISMLAEAEVDQTTIKKIVGHSGAMTLTERVYTHLDIQMLIEAVNKI